LNKINTKFLLKQKKNPKYQVHSHEELFYEDYVDKDKIYITTLFKAKPYDKGLEIAFRVGTNSYIYRENRKIHEAKDTLLK
jgi:hypothetical protein